MSKIFIDTEFLEGTQKNFFGKSKPTIDLISIGLVAEDGREYYAISKEFNLKDAWNRYDEKVNMDYKPSLGGYLDGHYNPMYIKEYWIRENVLLPIYIEYVSGDDRNNHEFSYSTMKLILNKYGKTNKQIAEDICQFVDSRYVDENDKSKGFIYPGGTSINEVKTTNIEFYGYYCDYDWVCFCWLFGKMISLPQGFPMYCRDLKQTFDEKQKFNHERYKVGDLKKFAAYPKQSNEHNALADAKWTFELYKFLEQL